MNGKNVIIRVDGGICSQIAFVSLGLWLSKNFGVVVQYDLSWFSEYGKDMNGVFVRNWDMEDAFPELNIDIASREEVRCARKYGVSCNTLEECIDACVSKKYRYIYIYVDIQIVL